MRYGLGLLSLLVVVGIILFIQAQMAAPVARQGKEAQRQAEQIAGRDETGRPATDSVTLEGQLAGGRMTALLVKDVTAGGAMQQHYGLQKGDEIVQIGDQPVEMFNGDEELAKGMLLDAYRAGRPLTVRRAGQMTTLTPAAGSGLPPGLNGVKIPMH